MSGMKQTTRRGSTMRKHGNNLSRIMRLFVAMTVVACAAAEQQVKIGVIRDSGQLLQPLEAWEGTRLALQRLDAMYTNTTVSVVTINVTVATPFDVYRTVCSLVAEGAVVFFTALPCSVVANVASFFLDLRTPIVSVDAACPASVYQQPYVLHYPPRRLHVSEAVGAVALNAKWREVALIYELDKVSAMEKMTSALHEVNTTVKQYPLDTGDLSAATARLIQRMYADTEPGVIDVYVVVICRLDCLVQLLDQANVFDVTNDNQAFYTFTVKWLLVVTETSWVDPLISAAKDVNHMSVILPDQHEYVSKSTEQNFHDVGTATLRLLGAILSSNTSTSDDPLTRVSDHRCQSPLNVATVGQQLWEDMRLRSVLGETRNVFVIYSAFWKPQRQRTFEVVGRWNPGNLRMQEDIFPNTKFGLNGKLLITATEVWSPFVFEQSGHYSGLCMQLLEELSKNLNFSYVIVRPTDRQWGTVDEHGNWTGLVRMIQRKDVDLIVAPLGVDVRRAQVMDFTNPFFFEYTTVMAKLPNPNKTKWRLYLRPFKWQAWLTFAASIPLAAVFLWLFTKFGPFYEKDSSQLSKQSSFAQFETTFWYILGTVFTQGGTNLPRAQSGRFVVGFWWMYCIVVIATFSGNLIAFLTVSKQTLPFQTLEELVAQNDIKFGMPSGTIFEMNFKNARSGINERVWRRVEAFSRTDPQVLSVSITEHLDNVMAGGYATIADKTTFEREMSEECGLEMIKENFLPLEYALGLQHQSAYKHLFSAEVTKARETGLLMKWKKFWWPRPNFCARGTVTIGKAVNLDDVQGAYYALSILCIVSCLTLLAEFIRGRPAVL